MIRILFMIHQISIIIPTLNEEQYLPKLLQSITDQKGYNGDYEVIVVDGDSKDSTVAAVGNYADHISRLRTISTHKGVAHQRNVGAAHAVYDTLFFIDADMVLSENFFKEITRRIVPNEIFVAVPLVLPLDGNAIDVGVSLASFTCKSVLRLFKPVVSGKCTITTRKNHQRVGGYNERIAFAEDVEYGIRSVKNGATYHLYFYPHLYTSMRRSRKMGTIQMIMTQLKAYLAMTMRGRITYKYKRDYPFGEH